MYTGWPKGWAVFRLAKEVWKEGESATNEKDRYQNSIFFPIGEPNPYGKYFVGQSYLAQISKEQIPVRCSSVWVVVGGIKKKEKRPSNCFLEA